MLESEEFRDTVEKHIPEVAERSIVQIARSAFEEQRYDAPKVLIEFYGSEKFHDIVDSISDKELAAEVTDFTGMAIAPLNEKSKDFSWIQGFLDLLHENRESPYVVRAIASSFRHNDNKHYLLHEYQKPEFKELMAAYASKPETARSIALTWPRTSEKGEDNGLKGAHKIFLEYASAPDKVTSNIMSRFNHWTSEKGKEKLIEFLEKYKANPEHVGKIFNACPGRYPAGDAEEVFIHLSDKFDYLVYQNFGDYMGHSDYDERRDTKPMVELMQKEAGFLNNEVSETVFPLAITMVNIGKEYHDKIKQAAQEKDFTMHLAQAWENILELPWKGSCCLVTHSRDIAAMKTEKGKEFTLEDIPMKPVTPREIHKMMGTEYADEEMRPFYDRSWTYHVHENQMNAFYENLKQKLDQGTAHDWLKEELLKTSSRN